MSVRSPSPLAGRARVALAGASLLASVLGAAGREVVLGTCGDELADEGPALYVDGTTNDGVYQSSAFEPEELLEFAPGQIIRFEHHLGAAPTSYQAYLAASRTGDGAHIVLATGNEVELLEIDDEAVTVKNGTCSDFFILLVAETRQAP